MKFRSSLKIVLALLFLILAKFSFSQSQEFIISGTIVESATNSPLMGVSVDLMVKNASVQRVTTKEGGRFQFQSQKALTFQIRINFTGYQLYSSSTVTTSSRNTDMGVISLVKNETKPPDNGPRIPANKIKIPREKFVEQKLTSLKYLPTKGSRNFFYALNPALRDSIEVPSDYKVRYPTLPSFRSTKKKFNKQFKRDKKKDGPYIYATGQAINFHRNENLAPERSTVKSLYKTASASANSLLHQGPEREETFFAGKTKKFVFVFFRINSNGQPEILENRYKVYYYTENVRGDESLYNKIGDATYGYAPMKATIYLIEVYDQQNKNKRVSVSDDEVDPQVFFMKGDLFNSWTKILIQVL